MQFSDFPGQDSATNLLKGMLAADRLPHALLFVDRRLWKTWSSIESCSVGIMSNVDEDFNACGTCNQCVKSKKLQHPDLLFFSLCGKDYRSDDFVEWKEAVLENPYLNYDLWSNILKVRISRVTFIKANVLT